MTIIYLASISIELGKGALKHNSRIFNTPNTNPERSHLNKEYINDDIKNVYHKLFDEAVERYNSKQTRNDRKVKNYYEKICNGKQEKPFHEIVVQIGNKNDFGIDKQTAELAEKALDDYVSTFQKRNPYLRVFSAHMHLDEATPHLHIDFVPFTTGSKRGLDTRVSLKQALANQGFVGNGREETEWALWVNSEKESLAESMLNFNNVSYDTSADKFPNYYKDVSLRMKNREIDLLIVVNMFLTGFDATTLNTLWVDKNLKDHGLIQAFSRTNRILNSVKTFGNIVCFRNLETATNNALALFGDKNARGMVILKTYNEYMNGYEDEHGKHIEGYNELVARLVNEFPISSQIIGEDNEKEFIKLFGRILKLRNILRCFDDFESDSSVSVRDLQDYQSVYIDLYQDYVKKSDIEKERINDDIVFEIELIKQVEVNIDYILMLVAKYHESNCEDKTILANINKSIDASVELRSKKALIEGFVAQMTVKTDVERDWKDFVKKQKEQDLEAIIKDEKLKHDEAQKFIENSFRDGGIKTTGTDLDKILPPISRFSGGSNRALKKQTVIDKLKDFFEKYFGLV